MKPIEESVVMVMDGSDKELFPSLPYILKDIWETGSDSAAVAAVHGLRTTASTGHKSKSRMIFYIAICINIPTHALSGHCK